MFKSTYQYIYNVATQEFEVLTIPINLEDIREKIAMFIMSQIVDPKGEFHLSSS